MKVCIKCGIEKDESEFYKHKYHKDGHESACKKCRSEYTKQLRKSDPTYKKRHQEQAKKYRDNNKEKVKESKNQYYINNKESIKEYIRKYFSDEINRKRKIRSNYNRISERIKSDPLFSLSRSISNLIRNSFKRNGLIKDSKTYDIIGCSFEEFKSYLESKFKSWMTWENRGLYNGEFDYGWDIDHIIPISSAQNVEELIKLNHYTNLQPLCSKTNRDIKRNNMIWGKI